jgi:TIR domain-containing protein
MTTHQKPVSVFVSYVHEDELLLRKLEIHLSSLKRQGLISTWSSRHIVPSTNQIEVIDQRLEQAQIILLLVSAHFLTSNYYYQIEMQRALERDEAGQARVIPIIMRPVDWKGAPFSHLQALPTGARPVTGRGWHNQDEAFADIAHGIRRAVDGASADIAHDIRRAVDELDAQSNHVPLIQGTKPKRASIPPKPTNIRVTYQPSREGNKGMILFVLNGTEQALEYIRNDRISHQIILLKQKQQELVRLVVPFATLKPLEKQAEFQIDGADGLLTFKMSAIASIMSVKLEVGGVEIFRQ